MKCQPLVNSPQCIFKHRVKKTIEVYGNQMPQNVIPRACCILKWTPLTTVVYFIFYYRLKSNSWPQFFLLKTTNANEERHRKCSKTPHSFSLCSSTPVFFLRILIRILLCESGLILLFIVGRRSFIYVTTWFLHQSCHIFPLYQTITLHFVKPRNFFHMICILSINLHSFNFHSFLFNNFPLWLNLSVTPL